jgi:hypothetical protein
MRAILNNVQRATTSTAREYAKTAKPIALEARPFISFASSKGKRFDEAGEINFSSVFSLALNQLRSDKTNQQVSEDLQNILRRNELSKTFYQQLLPLVINEFKEVAYSARGGDDLGSQDYPNARSGGQLEGKKLVPVVPSLEQVSNALRIVVKATKPALNATLADEKKSKETLVLTDVNSRKITEYAKLGEGFVAALASGKGQNVDGESRGR